MNRFKKFLALFVIAIFSVCCFAGCGAEEGVTAGATKNNLTAEGYSTSTYSALQFDSNSLAIFKTTEIGGVQRVLYAQKKNDQNEISEIAFMLFFDSNDHVSNITDEVWEDMKLYVEDFLQTSDEVLLGTGKGFAFVGTNGARVDAQIGEITAVNI